MTSIKYGVYGGLAGGVVFGAMMGMMGMLPHDWEHSGESDDLGRVSGAPDDQRGHRRHVRGAG